MSVLQFEGGNKKRRACGISAIGLAGMRSTSTTSKPTPALSERAGERTFQLESALFEADQAASCEPVKSEMPEPIQVDKAEYLDLLRCREIVRRALAEYVSDEEL